MTPHEHGHQHAHAHDHAPDGDLAMAEVLDLDAEVLAGPLAEAVDRVAELVGDGPCGNVVDLGAGTGTGTLALLRRFPAARVTAVDVSAAMLGRLQEAVARAGAGDRVEAVEADLDAAWPALGPADLVWAAQAQHHLADPARGLAELTAVLRPGGLLAVVELEGFPRFLPDDVGLGRPGLEARCHAALAAARQGPEQDVDWGARLSAAGLEVLDARVVDVDLAPPLPEATGRYAQLCLGRVRAGLADVVDPEDLATLDALLSDGPQGLRQRGDLGVRTRRSLWVARRP